MVKELQSITLSQLRQIKKTEISKLLPTFCKIMEDYTFLRFLLESKSTFKCFTAT